MYPTWIDPALKVLEQLLHTHPPAADDTDADLILKKSIQATHRDLRFLKMFLWGMAYQDDWDSRYDLITMRYKLNFIGEIFNGFHHIGLESTALSDWNPEIYQTGKEIEQLKPFLKQICISVLGAPIKPFQFEELFLEYGSTMVSFIDLILDNLGVLESSFDLTPFLKQRFRSIEMSFKVFGKLANHISCLAYLHSIEERDQKFFKPHLESMLSNMVLRYMPYSLEVTTLYLDLFKTSGDHDYGRSVYHRLTVSYAESLLDHLLVSKSLRDRFIGWSSYFMDHSGENMNLLADIFEFFSYISCNDVTLVLHFNDCPKTNAIGFLDSLLANLEKILNGKLDIIPMAKHEAELVHKQLVLIRPVVQNKLKVINEEEKLKDLWSQIVNMLYSASYVVKLCTMKNVYSLYGILYAPHVIENIKLVMSEIEKIVDNLKYDTESTVATGVELIRVSSSSSGGVFLPRATISRDEGAFVGYKQDVEELLNYLLRGTKDRRIICVSGMGGQGKTTLAKKIYNNSSVCYYFHKKVWCYVSKECKPRELLANIVSDDGTYDSIHDLADCVRKSLKGKRYFIILDDIWDVEVWNVVQSAFPNDGNGSRILFTSRNHNLASKADSNSLSHRLRPFSHEESLELLKQNLSNCDDIPGEFLETGRRISDQCKGLPLAVALIGPVLKRAGFVLDLWKNLAVNLNAYLGDEGCKDIIDLSYQYLPEHLKPCLLYLGGFPRNRDINAGNVKRLWIAEGFVTGDQIQLANEYLEDLVSQNLVVVTERSSRGGIKGCRIHHDLLYDLCLEKAFQDNFLQQTVPSCIVSGSKRNDFYHRLFINTPGPFSLPNSTGGAIGALPCNQIHTLLIYCSWHVQVSPKSLRNLRALKVLDFRYLSTDMLLEVIWFNIHLRHLALGPCIREIPPSIVDLWNLETLIVNGPARVDVQIPAAMWEMESLKYVEINYFCLNLEDLWQNNMAATGNIEVLKGLSLEFDSKANEFLRRFVRLRNVTCRLPRENVVHPVWFSMFVPLENLESLHLYCFGYGCKQKFPPSTNFSDNLKKMNLEGFELPWNALSPIGMLPNLEVLKLKRIACLGTIWHLEDGEFSKLRFLKLHSIREIEQIDDSGCDETPFPRLQKLILQYCKELKEIPSSFSYIYSLDTIDVSHCHPSLSLSVSQIVEQQ